MAISDRTRNKIRVIGINGSLRRASYTRMALNLALQGAREVGAEVGLLDLRDYEIVFCDGETKGDALPLDVHRLRREIKAAQGIILGTPEYHGSFSGVLKNALDLMGFEEFEGKMVGLVGVSGGKMGALNALNGLRTVGRALHAWVVPEQVSVPEAWRLFDEEGHLADLKLESAVKQVGRQVARFAFLHHSEQAQEFLEVWETAPENPGGNNR